MSTPDDLKKAIDALLPFEQEDLLRHLTKQIDAAHQRDPIQKIACQGRWATEEESELQYFIPEMHYQSAKLNRGEDQ